MIPLSKSYKTFFIFTYKYERLKGLSPLAYFLSKWILLTVVVGILAPLVLVGFIVLIYMQPLPDFPGLRINESPGWWEQLIRFQVVGLLTRTTSWLVLITLVLSCITSITLGLLISAMAGDSDKEYLYLSFMVVFIVLFSGLIQNEKLEQIVDWLSFLSTGRWAFEGFSSSISIYCWLDSWRFAEFNSTGHIISIWLSLGAFSMVTAFLTVMALRIRDPWYGRLANLRQVIICNWRPINVSSGIQSKKMTPQFGGKI